MLHFGVGVSDKMDENEKIAELLEDGDPTGLEAEGPDPSQEIAQIEHPFDPDKIKVLTENKTINLLLTGIKYNEIDLAPEFQRHAGIWDQGRKSRLIESILLRIPLPVFYVATDVQERWSVVDGLQRMTTIRDFVKNEFRLRGLEYMVGFDRKRFSDLPRNMQRRIEETELVINAIQPGIPEEVMFNIFSRINTGGMTLNSQEIRHALNKGPVRGFLQDLVKIKDFELATSGSVRDIRMSARECALRFAAFYLVSWKGYKNNDLDGFLNSAMKRINEMSEDERTVIRSAFTKAMSASHRVLGDDAFRKRYRLDAAKKPVSKALFESWSVTFAKLSDEDIDYLAGRSSFVVKKFIDTLLEDRDFEVSISYATGVPARVRKRFSTIENLVKGALNNE